jgi:hypothetical protein
MKNPYYEFSARLLPANNGKSILFYLVMMGKFIHSFSLHTTTKNEIFSSLKRTE